MPHLQELVKLYSDKPFAVVGVNYGDSPEDYRKGLETYKVSWISAYQEGESNPIVEKFKVQGFPTYYLLDTDGKIVEVGHSSSAMDASIKRLVEAATAE